MTTRSRPRSAWSRRDFARMSVTVSRLDSSTKIGACCSRPEAAEIATNSCCDRRPRRMRFPSISASIEMSRCTTCISLISIEKTAQVLR